MNEQEVMNSVKVLGVSHEEAEWVRYINFEYEGEDYECRLLWNQQTGFEMLDWGDMPNELRSAADGFICQILDELSYDAMKEQEAN